MGTNYYLEHDVCSHCDRPGARVHVGKSSAGWTWLWRGYRGFAAENLPFGREILSGDDWWQVLGDSLAAERPGRIVNEYGRELSLAELRERVESKRGAGRRGSDRMTIAGVSIDTETYPDGPDDISFRSFS